MTKEAVPGVAVRHDYAERVERTWYGWRREWKSETGGPVSLRIIDPLHRLLMPIPVAFKVKP